MAFAAQQQSGHYVAAPRFQQNLVGTTTTAHFIIDSRARDVSRDPSAAHFTVKLDKPLERVVSIKLTRALVPILDPAVHPSLTATELSTAAVLRLEDLPTGDGLRGTTRPDGQGNAIADDGALAVIPMNAQISANLGGGVIARYTDWRSGDQTPDTLFFRAPLHQLTELRIRLVEWGESTHPQSYSRTYPIPAETAPASSSAPSGLLQQNNAIFVFEITAMK